MIELYFAPTANGLRATVALEEAALPYRIHALDLYKGEQHTPEFQRINPAGLVLGDAIYGLPYDPLAETPEAWPAVYQNRNYRNIFAAGDDSRWEG